MGSVSLCYSIIAIRIEPTLLREPAFALGAVYQIRRSPELEEVGAPLAQILENGGVILNQLCVEGVAEIASRLGDRERVAKAGQERGAAPDRNGVVLHGSS